MPVVGFKPPQKPPNKLAFFSYGCCVSTTQALWMIIGTFFLAVMLIISCCFAGVFVRWVYKRRMRKKLEALKDKYKDEERHKKELEMNLRELAKRPCIPPPKNPTTEILRNIERSLQQMNAAQKHSETGLLNLSGRAGTNQGAQQQAPPVMAQGVAQNQLLPPVENKMNSLEPLPNGDVVFDATTVGAVVHHLALTNACTRNNHPAYPGVAIRQELKQIESVKKDSTERDSMEKTQKTSLELPVTKGDTDPTQSLESGKDEEVKPAIVKPIYGVVTESNKETGVQKTSPKKELEVKKTSPKKEAENKTQTPENEDVTQENEEEEDSEAVLQKRVTKSVFKTGFPYWKGYNTDQSVETSAKMTNVTGSASGGRTGANSEFSTTGSLATKRSVPHGIDKTQHSSDKTQPSATPGSRQSSIPPGFDVYELRRIVEEQSRMAETLRVKAMLGERERAPVEVGPDMKPKRGISSEEVRARVGGKTPKKYVANVVQTKDVPNNEEKPSPR